MESSEPALPCALTSRDTLSLSPGYPFGPDRYQFAIGDIMGMVKVGFAGQSSVWQNFVVKEDGISSYYITAIAGDEDGEHLVLEMHTRAVQDNVVPVNITYQGSGGSAQIDSLVLRYDGSLNYET